MNSERSAPASAEQAALSTPHLISIRDATRADLELIFHHADQFKEVLSRPIKKVPSLRDMTVANLFFENSTRTRISFELAEKRLSADVVNFSASSSSVKKGETLLDTVNNILAMKVDLVVMRHPSPGAPVFLSRHIDAQIINAGDGTHEHPTQAILDAYSIRERMGKVEGLKVVIVGDIMHSRVALSNIFCLQTLGAEVMVCGPPTLIPPHIGALGVHVSHHLPEALAWCDVANVLRIQLERMDGGPDGAPALNYFPSLREYANVYGVNRALLDSLQKEVLILHPGPMNRGVEITSDVADSGQAIILDQVQNGVATRMAVLYLLAAVRRGTDTAFG
jgi:aspartate carbamoyltransferase catalytic subunit